MNYTACITVALCSKWSRILSDVSHLVSELFSPTLLTWFFPKNLFYSFSNIIGSVFCTKFNVFYKNTGHGMNQNEVIIMLQRLEQFLKIPLLSPTLIGIIWNGNLPDYKFYYTLLVKRRCCVVQEQIRLWEQLFKTRSLSSLYFQSVQSFSFQNK